MRLFFDFFLIVFRKLFFVKDYDIMQPIPLWKSALKALLVTFGAIFGFFLAIIFVVSLIQWIDTAEDELPQNYSMTIRPNGEGVRKKLSKSAPAILELQINGIIGTPELNQQTVESLLVESREYALKDNRVKGILLSINSPGGTVNDADGIYRALLNYKSRYKVPIFAYTEGLCASGGMYIACAADEIYSADTTLVGSVGVISPPFFNVVDLMNKVGVSALTLSAGIGKDEMNPLRPWKKDEDKSIQEIIQHYYADFVHIITTHRPKMSKQDLVEVYGAQVFPGSKAAELGYVDGSGYSRDDVLKKLTAKLSIEDDYYQVVQLESTNWLAQLFKTESPLFKGKMQHEIKIQGNVPENMAGKPLYLYRP
jgi:protease IV